MISSARWADDRVGGEERHAGAGAEDDDAALLEVADRAPRDVGLGDLAHRDRGLHARLDALLLEEVLQREAVHHGAEHAHVVGARAVHALLLQLGAAEEVAAADDDGDLDALVDRLGDLAGDRRARRRGRARPAAAEDLAGELEQHPAAGGRGGRSGWGGLLGGSSHDRSSWRCGAVTESFHTPAATAWLPVAAAVRAAWQGVPIHAVRPVGPDSQRSTDALKETRA